MAAGVSTRRSRVRVVAFDLDGTLLRGDTVCEVLARPLGRLGRMRELEAASMRAELAAARVEMANWYQRYSQVALEELVANARLAPGAEAGCRWLRAAGVEILIASVTWSFAVAVFARRLGACAWIGTGLASDGTIDHVWPEDKARWLRAELARRGVAAGEAAAVGDSAGDVPMLGVVGVPMFVGAAVPEGAPEGLVHLPDADILELARRLVP
jgi:HAD superfamily phosphoserine phosphatase-like hydrolase